MLSRWLPGSACVDRARLFVRSLYHRSVSMNKFKLGRVLFNADILKLAELNESGVTVKKFEIRYAGFKRQIDRAGRPMC